MGVKWHGVLQLCHFFFFANDAYLYFWPTAQESLKVKDILAADKSASRQKVNLSKSFVSVAWGVGLELRSQIYGVLGVCKVADDGTYLGMLVSVGQNKKAVFEYIKDRIQQKVQSWSSQPLSRSGKEVMIKTVLQAILSYVMNFFLLPSDLCDEIKRILKGY